MDGGSGSPLAAANRRPSSTLSKSQTKTSAAFQLVKCNVCQIEFTKKDLARHSDTTCKSFIENHFHLSGDKIDHETLAKTALFEDPFLMGPITLFTPSICSVNKAKLLDTKANDKIIFLSGELMRHIDLGVSSYVSVQDINDDVSRGYFRVHQATASDLKSCLSVGFLKDDVPGKRNAARATVLRIRLNVITTELKSVQMSILREFSDPLIYLNVCSNIKKHLTNRLIVSHEKFISVIANNIEYDLEINGMVVGHRDETLIEKKFVNLSISSKHHHIINGNLKQENDQAYIITGETVVIFPPIKRYVPAATFVGYERQIKLLRSVIVKPLAEESKVENLPKTILLTGPTGTGKTLAIRTLLSELQTRMNIAIIPSALLVSKSLEFEKLNQVFRNLIKLKPSLLFLDNLEDISNEKNQLEKRIVAWLKVFFDDLPKSDHVVVVGATNRADLLDNTLRRPGRFDIEVDFPVPTAQDRKLILAELLNHFRHELTGKQIEELASTAHGYTGVDLESLCRTYLLNQNESQSEKIIRFSGLMELLSRTKPSTMREIVLETPSVRWSDIGGMRELKRRLEECVVWPIKQPEAFLQMGIDPPKGILMYGPPGCCKTMIGKALAHESGLNFFSIKGPELFSKWVGESERAVREIFRRARAASPSILFFDEIDALATERGQTQSAVGDRVLAQLLTEIDGIETLTQVIIIAATNRPDIVDKALLRPGRLDSVVYVPLPDLETRKEILRIRLAKMPLDETVQRDQLLEDLARRSDGYSGAEINAICQRAALLALAANVRRLNVEHFFGAFDMVKPRTAPETIEFFERFASKYNVMV